MPDTNPSRPIVTGLGNIGVAQASPSGLVISVAPPPPERLDAEVMQQLVAMKRPPVRSSARSLLCPFGAAWLRSSPPPRRAYPGRPIGFRARVRERSAGNSRAHQGVRSLVTQIGANKRESRPGSLRRQRRRMDVLEHREMDAVAGGFELRRGWD